MLVDEKNELGGSTIYENNEFNKIDNKTPSEWLKKEIEELKGIKNLEIKTRTSVAAYHQYNYLFLNKYILIPFGYLFLTNLKSYPELNFQAYTCTQNHIS